MISKYMNPIKMCIMNYQRFFSLKIRVYNAFWNELVVPIPPCSGGPRLPYASSSHMLC